ncbi:cystathionine beta-lyase [Phenylobacterium zucineum HLK1]|uniref:Cystathionine beta-lyase n=1 Tax=Phenylobacterium zucineum (strain HLK1) TaxID=450851 RepID=B4R9W1_PHEZH|nr:cystathionine beta-lyase [Phenylobacterium zucineum]ACG77875.1 cystathionine beta-lyase [Phenylobacterium zucineum HLK1]
MRDPTLCLTPGDGLGGAFESLAVPVHRASTVVFPTVAAYQGRRDEIYDGFSYGLYGTPTSRELETRLARLEGAARTLALPSGFAAIAMTTLAAVRPGEEVLFPDTTYDTVRPFAERFLAGLGIGSRYYDPMIGAGLAEVLDGGTRLVWVESPGSMTMEVQDVPAIAAAAHARGAMVAADNTWATPLRFKALAHGVDFSVCALSKYVAGHSDVMMGSVSVNDVGLYRKLKDYSRFLGLGVSADESSLVLRGLETLAIRMDRAEQSARRLVDWVVAQPGVAEVRFPQLATSPGHALWRRDFTGGAGLFSVFLEDWTRPALAEAVESLQLFAIGASWGGTRSLVAVLDRPPLRTVAPPAHTGPVVRFSIGLEDPEDLLQDLARGFARLAAPDQGGGAQRRA